MQLPLSDRVMSQYHLFVCNDGDFVRIEGASSSPVADAAVARVLASLEVLD